MNIYTDFDCKANLSKETKIVVENITASHLLVNTGGLVLLQKVSGGDASGTTHHHLCEAGGHYLEVMVPPHLFCLVPVCVSPPFFQEVSRKQRECHQGEAARLGCDLSSPVQFGAHSHSSCIIILHP